MIVKIKISKNAKKQRELLALIPSELCGISNDIAKIGGVYEESKRVHDVLRYNIKINNGILVIENASSEKGGMCCDVDTRVKKKIYRFSS